MTNEDDDSRLKGATIICNGCGNPMRDYGILPLVQWPKHENPNANYQVCHKFAFSTCRISKDDYVNGVSMMISLVIVRSK